MDIRPAAGAFDAIAADFDRRFGSWASVAAQRRAVRSALLRSFPRGGRIFEIGAGTGEDAMFLAQQGFKLLVTDPSPSMVSIARKKLARFPVRASLVSGEGLDEFAEQYFVNEGCLFDGAFSNFAALNCVLDLGPVARGLAKLLKPEARAMLVVFGDFCPNEMVTEVLRKRPRLALRRLRPGPGPARLGGREFQVFYHRRSDLVEVFSPWFVLERRIGIGIAVPPSAAEPWISRHPRLLGAMERIDRFFAGPLAPLGDHILYQFRRLDKD
jgi:SAM-dependent methyltransferase